MVDAPSSNMCASSSAAAARLNFANTLLSISKENSMGQNYFITEGAALAAGKEEMILREAEMELTSVLAMEESTRANLTRAISAREEAVATSAAAKAQALNSVIESETRSARVRELIAEYNNAASVDENAAVTMDREIAELLTVKKTQKETMVVAVAESTDEMKAKAATAYYNGLRGVLTAAVL